jgi:hypothetical protein
MLIVIGILIVVAVGWRVVTRQAVLDTIQPRRR